MLRGFLMHKIQEKLFSLVLGGLVIGIMFHLAQELSVYTTSDNIVGEGRSVATNDEATGGTRQEEMLQTKEKICVVLDAGHGGFDPGKIGVNGQKEAEINLAIAEKVKMYLEANDILVIMTRETDEGLYDENSDNKKVQDMKRRIEIIEKNAPAAAVSIHQNSYTEEYVNGAQVFYYADSREGECLAEFLQASLKENINPKNHRQKKANSSYYLLKKTMVPTVIVECGFLSNYKEATLLENEEYQDKLAWAIHMGILQYINEK